MTSNIDNTSGINAIKPIKNNFVFKFLDPNQDGRFINRTKSSIILTNKNDEEQTSVPRWGEVISIGPDVSEFKPGEFVLVGAGRWSQFFKIDGEKYWKSDSEQVLAVTDEIDITYSY